uniref:Uncharacterized protein n=1 Tax=Arundo donax TaxID=35708 RepID=A0A0A9TL92_ARUDO
MCSNPSSGKGRRWAAQADSSSCK